MSIRVCGLTTYCLLALFADINDTIANNQKSNEVCTNNKITLTLILIAINSINQSMQIIHYCVSYNNGGGT